MSASPTLHSEDGHPALAKSAPTSPRPSTSIHSKDAVAVDEKKAKDRSPPQGMSTAHAPIEVSKTRFILITIALMFSIFLFALDQLITATALPSITAAFNGLDKLSWVASGFFLTLLGFTLIYSQWSQIFPSKVVIMFAIVIFELGSLICGVAPSMDVLILGRAVAGVGAAGIFSGGMLIIAELTPLSKRAQYFGLFGVCFALASVLGPLVGGAFSDHVSWRWCFYINLPFGGIALAMIILAQPMTPPLGRAASYKGFNKDMIMQVAKCDWLGAAISMAWACCLILFMQWGGVTKPWNDGSVIATAVLSFVLIPVFLAWEWSLGEKAMFKMRLLRRRTIAGASAVLFNLFAVFMLEVYYISVAFQAVYHTSATGAGVRLLPFIMVQIVVLIASSRIIPLIGRYKYIIVAGPFFLALGAGLLYSVKYGDSVTHVMGFQVFLGIGIGLALQNSMLSIQHTLKSEPWLISAGTGLGVFLGFAGRIVGISLAGSVFENMLQVNLRKYSPQTPPNLVHAIISSATAVWDTVPDDLRPSVLKAYTETLRQVYIIGVPFALLGLAGALCMKNSKMQTKAEEAEALQAAKDKDAGTGENEDVEAKKVVDAEEEERFAEGVSAVAPQETVVDTSLAKEKV